MLARKEGLILQFCSFFHSFARDQLLEIGRTNPTSTQISVRPKSFPSIRFVHLDAVGMSGRRASEKKNQWKGITLERTLDFEVWLKVCLPRNVIGCEIWNLFRQLNGMLLSPLALHWFLPLFINWALFITQHSLSNFGRLVGWLVGLSTRRSVRVLLPSEWSNLTVCQEDYEHSWAMRAGWEADMCSEQTSEGNIKTNYNRDLWAGGGGRIGLNRTQRNKKLLLAEFGFEGFWITVIKRLTFYWCHYWLLCTDTSGR